MFVTTRVSFVVVNWGEAEATAVCVESIKAQQAAVELEIIIVDNESTPASRSRLSQIPGTTVVAHSENRGFTGGMNAGFAIATGAYVAAVNNDLVLAPDWLANGLVELACDRVGVVGGVEFAWDDDNPPGNTSNISYGLCLVDERTGFRAGYGERGGEPPPTQDVCALDGNNMLMPRRIVEELGGFDDDFFAYYEDVDLCARALALGHRIRFCAEMKVWHRRNLSSDRMPYRRWFLAQRNHLVFVARHFPETSWRPTVRRLAYQYLVFGIIGREAGVRGWSTAAPLDWRRRRANLASGLWGLSHLSYLGEKRRQTTARGQRSDSYITRLRASGNDRSRR